MLYNKFALGDFIKNDSFELPMIGKHQWDIFQSIPRWHLSFGAGNNLRENMNNSEEYEYAGFWVRVGASLIDILLLLLITAPLTMIAYGDSMWESEKIILGPADFLINYILPFVATILFWLYTSATPGKMALKIKIVNASDGAKLKVGQSVIRYFAYIPAMLVLCIGFFWIGFDKRKQGWHDKLAKTVVIQKKNANATEKVKFET